MSKKVIDNRYMMKHFTPSDCVFATNGNEVMGAGYPITNLFMECNLAPMSTDNSDAADDDESKLVSRLFKGDLGVPLGLFVENIATSNTGKPQGSTSDVTLMPEPLYNKLVSMVEVKRPTSIKPLSRRKRPTSSRKTRKNISSS